MPSNFDRREFLIVGSATTALVAVRPTPLLASNVRVRIVDLKVDHIDRPFGLENRHPKLSWRIESGERDVRQRAYRVLVASSEEILQAGRADLWDSGKVPSNKSLGISYGGPDLESRQRCWWHVQVWDEHDAASEPSAISWWEMGLLEQADWTAQWLAVEDAVARADREAGFHWIWDGSPGNGGSHKFRYSLDLPVAASAGELIAVANDWYWYTQLTRIWIDGRPIGGPGVWIDLESVYNPDRPEALSLSRLRLILEPLSAGRHVIAVEVRTGDSAKHGGPIPLPGPIKRPVPGITLFTRLILENGETLRIGTNPTWKTSEADHDHWYRIEYDDREWRAAQSASASLQDYQPWPPRPAMHMRRAFSLEKPVIRARLYATALGAYEASLNGQRIGDALLTPEPSQYAKRVLYRTYDATPLLKSGNNVIGLTVGDGWYAAFDGHFSWAPPPRRVIAQLELELADGSRQVVATGPEWRTMASGIQASEIKIGEIYDARLEQPGWDTANFSDVHWQPILIADVPSCRLTAQVSPPIRVAETLQPQAIWQRQPGVHVVDFGQHFTGGCRMRINGQPGARVELLYAENVAPSGAVDQSNMRDPTGEPKRDVHFLKGDPSGELLESHFCFRGFRYVEIHGLESAPAKDAIEGLFLYTDLAVTGQIRSDGPLIQQIWRSILQSQKSNFVGIPTDNTIRELRGYLNDSLACFWDTAAFNMDVAAFTTRYMDNVADDQNEMGAFPIFSPMPRHNSGFYHIPSGTPPGWGDAGVILPWVIWQRYGDASIIERHWEPMNRYLQFILNHNPDFILRHQRSWDFSDWLAFDTEVGLLNAQAPTTPRDLIGTAYWAHSANLLMQMAEVIGRTEAVDHLRTIFEQVRRAFNDTFVKHDGIVGNGSQTSYVLALAFNLLPEGIRQTAAERLAADIRDRGTHLTTGTLTTQFILEVLTEAGFATLAYDLLLRTEPPSWGYMMRQGANTIWERWKGTGARNQFAFGAIGGFLFRCVAGIDAAQPGFEAIVIRPRPDARVKHGGGDYDSVMGRISTDWMLTPDGEFTLEVAIPANTTAQIHLPARRTSQILEGGKEIVCQQGLRLTSRSDHEAVIKVGSGTYRFVVTG